MHIELINHSAVQASQGGQIGITLLGWWHEPATDTPQDAAAAARMNDFHIGWSACTLELYCSLLLQYWSRIQQHIYDMI